MRNISNKEVLFIKTLILLEVIWGIIGAILLILILLKFLK
jgi:hypothetical protein